MGGKDTVTGHWEMMGVTVAKPFPTYPKGFPPEIIDEFKRRIGRDILGNYPASGTKIIDDLGPEHMRTGRPIVYTSADSVFQIACHEEIVPIEELYHFCRVAREICTGEHGVQRVIARPFEGQPGSFRRTERRKDFPLTPPENMIDHLAAAERTAQTLADMTAKANAFHDKVLPLMDALRSAADDAETICSDKYWPLPSYSQMLYYVEK